VGAQGLGSRNFHRAIFLQRLAGIEEISSQLGKLRSFFNEQIEVVLTLPLVDRGAALARYESWPDCRTNDDCFQP
jgi:hypothetical protein